MSNPLSMELKCFSADAVAQIRRMERNFQFLLLVCLFAKKYETLGQSQFSIHCFLCAEISHPGSGGLCPGT